MMGVTTIALHVLSTGELKRTNKWKNKQEQVSTLSHKSYPTFCTKFQSPRCSSSRELFDRKKKIYRHIDKHTENTILYSQGYKYYGIRGLFLLAFCII